MCIIKLDHKSNYTHLSHFFHFSTLSYMERSPFLMNLNKFMPNEMPNPKIPPTAIPRPPPSYPPTIIPMYNSLEALLLKAIPVF